MVSGFQRVLECVSLCLCWFFWRAQRYRSTVRSIRFAHSARPAAREFACFARRKQVAAAAAIATVAGGTEIIVFD